MADRVWSLRELIGAVNAADFVTHHWGRRAFSCNISESSLAWLRGELDDFDVHKLVRRYRGHIGVWFDTLEGGQRAVAAASADDALALYEAGMTVFLHNGAATPAIMRFERQLADDIGHPGIPLAASLFLSRRSAATGPHFDTQENITIQLRGHKRWRVAPNPCVRHPLENWALDMKPSPALLRMLERDLPTAMPEDAESFDLSEGNLIYVPRGHFHETEASSDAVSLFLGLPSVSWADLLLDAMRIHLENLPHWRENVLGGTSPECVRRARHRLDELRGGLADDLRGLASEFLLPDFKGPLDVTRQLRKNPLTSLQVTLGNTLTLVVALPLGKLQRKQTLSAPKEVAPILDWIAPRSAFIVGEALDAHPTIDRDLVLQTLTMLQETGVLT